MNLATRPRRTSAKPPTSAQPPRWPTDPTTRYALDVGAGRIIAGPHVRAACARHLRDLVEGPTRGLRWNPALEYKEGRKRAADRIIKFFPDALRLNGGEHEGKPFVLGAWEAFIVGSLFGWIKADGYRRFRQAYVETAKGSGKTPLAAGIGHYMLAPDGEARAEVYCAATKKDQAMVLFRDAVAMADQSPALSKRLKKSGAPPNVWNLAHTASSSFFRPIASEDGGQSGPRPHCALIDEIHEHKSDTVVEMMRGGTKGRRQPLIFMITNSGYDRESVCYRLHEYGTKVAAGDLVDDEFFAYICASDEGEDPITDPPDPALGYPRCWPKTNPSIGVTFAASYLEGQVREARGMPAKESLVRRLNFCEWTGSANPWIDQDLWRACEVDEMPACDVATSLGLDLSAKRDLTAAAREWQLPLLCPICGVTVASAAEAHVAAELRFWTPADTLEERERTDRVPYSAWVRSGHLIAVPGRSIDYGFVVKDLAEWIASAAGCAFDQWRIDDFQRALDDAGVDNWIWDPPKPPGVGLRLVRHGQGWGGGAVELDEHGAPRPKRTLWMPRSITQLEDLVVKGRLHVLRNPCLTYNSASAVLERDPAGNAKWEKRKSTGRIDGIVALCQANGLASSEGEPPAPQVLGVSDTQHQREDAAPGADPERPPADPFFGDEEGSW